ncbi:MAG: phosphate signaling complex protein PhoU [Defluviitaleaceae bacterium]|nr:phosphate signaling complex protein PhoU [Defluviitaleaceae bacterium]
MMRRFDKQLAELGNMLLEMSALAERSISLAARALIKRDAGLAEEVIRIEEEVNLKEREVEALCLKLLLQQQPVAKDLRLISSVLKIITDLERIGDQAADISGIVIAMDGGVSAGQSDYIPQMGAAVIKMVSESMDAFVKKDAKLARAVIEYDDVVDGLFDSVKNDLIELIRADKANGGQAIDLLMAAKYFERIGDHACNIAEWVAYSVTGKRKGKKGK